MPPSQSALAQLIALVTEFPAKCITVPCLPSQSALTAALKARVNLPPLSRAPGKNHTKRTHVIAFVRFLIESVSLSLSKSESGKMWLSNFRRREGQPAGTRFENISFTPTDSFSDLSHSHWFLFEPAFGGYNMQLYRCKRRNYRQFYLFSSI